MRSDGSWSANFVPTSIRSYPFAVGFQENGDQQLLFIEDSELIVDRNEGHPLFDEDGKETPVIQYYIDLLNGVAQSRIKIKEA